MKGTNIGEFEELILLTVAALSNGAYSVAICDEIENVSGRKTKLGVVHPVLNRLETKGLLASHLGEATKTRGGRRKRYYEVTHAGKATLMKVREQRELLWSKIENISLDRI